MPTAMPRVWRARFDERALVQKQLGSQCDAHASARRAPTETRGLETALSLACVCVALCAPGDRRYVTCVVCVPRFVGFGESGLLVCVLILCARFIHAHEMSLRNKNQK